MQAENTITLEAEGDPSVDEITKRFIVNAEVKVA